MVLDGQLDSTYAYSFIVTDIPIDEKTTAEVEFFHRQRAQIEERFKDAKLGHALRHLPSRDLNANRLWLCCCLTGAQHLRLGMRHQPRRPRLRPGSRQTHATAPPRQDTPPAAVLRPRPDHPHRPPDDHAPARRVPALRDLQHHLPRRARAPRPITTPVGPSEAHTPQHHPRRRPGKRPPRRPTNSPPPINATGDTPKHPLVPTRPPPTADVHRYPGQHTPRSATTHRIRSDITAAVASITFSHAQLS